MRLSQDWNGLPGARLILEQESGALDEGDLGVDLGGEELRDVIVLEAELLEVCHELDSGTVALLLGLLLLVTRERPLTGAFGLVLHLRQVVRGEAEPLEIRRGEVRDVGFVVAAGGDRQGESRSRKGGRKPARDRSLCVAHRHPRSFD
jgi:hypothetical protein